MLNIVLFGPPGAGKGTQADKLLEKYGILHISTGEVIRNEIKKGTELGLQAQKEMEGGKLASDQIVISIICDYVKSNKDAKGAIYDGFPRTTLQAEAFDKLLEKNDEKVTLMLSLEVADEELISRLLNRGLTSGRADDQNREVIENRIKVYKAQTEVVKDYYNKQGKLVEIDGLGTIDEIFERLSVAIDEYI
ncbi:MAG: adenylate kinase [Rikenellaceae bacterium]